MIWTFHNLILIGVTLELYYIVLCDNKCLEGLVSTQCGTFISCKNLDEGNCSKPTKCEHCACENEAFVYDETKKVCVYPVFCPNSKENKECKKQDKHSEYKMCQSPTSIPTCNDPVPGSIYSDECLTGCFCKDGYVKNEKEGKCVKPHDCPKQCDSLENICKKCDNTCENMYSNETATEEDCPTLCECGEGYVRNSKNQCILPPSCPPDEVKCPYENAIFNGCGSFCPDTCETIYATASVCNDLCRTGCECKPGFVLNGTENCIDRNSCPTPGTQCRENETYNKCGIPRDCNSTMNTGPCKPGCFCNDPFLYDDISDSCVIEKRCAGVRDLECKRLNPRTEYKECQSSSCVKTCKHPIPDFTCTDDCVNGCFCSDPYVRNSIGSCVEVKDCAE